MEGLKVKVICAIFVLFFLGAPALAADSYDLIVVRADIPTEYVVASVYGNYKDIPIVLVNPDEIPENVKSEMRGYVSSGYKNLLLVGGKDAISVNVEDELTNMGFSVTRLWDWNREGTAGRVAIELWGKSDYIVLVEGSSYDSLLTAQRFAMKNSMPVLFTSGGNVPDETRTAIARIGARKAYAFGPVGDGLGIEVEQMSSASADVGSVSGAQFNLLPFALIGVAIVAVVLLTRGRLPSQILTSEEKKIMYAIRKKPLNQNELPAITGFSKPKVSRLVQNLEERGIIERKKAKRTYVVEPRMKVE
ncbi:MAG: MarR family transcriptional regulator [Candidatus Aenigmatarchaeota archaeon]